MATTKAVKAAPELDPLAEFRDALDKESGSGRDLDRAREIADKYISEHPDQFTDYVNMTTQEISDAASVLRAAGMDDAATRVEMWVRAKFEPQNIGGEVEAVRRAIPGFDEDRETK